MVPVLLLVSNLFYAVIMQPVHKKWTKNPIVLDKNAAILRFKNCISL